jgi:hypothetical protein
MSQRKTRKSPKGRTNVGTSEPKRWRTYLLIFVCSLGTVSGIFFAGKQHFSSMDYGMKNSRLRRQIDDLEAEKRRLLVAREVSLSPAELKKAAKKAGLAEAIETVSVPAQLSLAKSKEPIATPVEMKKTVIKTASVTPVPASVAAVYPKTEKAVKPVKKTVSTE